MRDVFVIATLWLSLILVIAGALEYAHAYFVEKRIHELLDSILDFTMKADAELDERRKKYEGTD